MAYKLVYEPTTRTVARTLLGAGAYCTASDMADEACWFTWKSGIRAPAYLDCRVLARDPGATTIVTKAMGSAIRANYPEVEYIVGVAEAGIIWSTLTAQELGKPHAFVRRQPKQHGRSGWVECSPPMGKRAIVVDDVMASGESLDKVGLQIVSASSEGRADPLHPLAIDAPPLLQQMLMGLAVPPPRSLPGERTQLRSDRRVIDSDRRLATLRGAMLSSQTTRPTLGEPEPFLQRNNSSTPPGRAQKFPRDSSLSP